MHYIRKNISDLILSTLMASDLSGPHQLARDTGLPQGVVDKSITHGLVELADWVAICRALGLDAGAALTEAANHRSSDTPVALSAPQSPLQQ